MQSIKEFIKIVNDIFSKNNINNYHSLSYSECETKEILLKALSTFINNLPYEEKIIMSSDIFYKFQENTDFEKVKKAKVLFTVYSKKMRSLRKLYFEKWRKYSSLLFSLSGSKLPKRKKLISNLE
jgi:aminopeptidase-like protein